MLTVTHKYELKLTAQVVLPRRHLLGMRLFVFTQLVANILRTLTKPAKGKQEILVKSFREPSTGYWSWQREDVEVVNRKGE